MRSRFSAFAVADAGYLLGSWHPSTRPAKLDLDEETRWTVLEIVETVRGGPFDELGTVAFRAHYRTPDVRGVLAERSRFLREDGRWWYLDGQSL
jgi:SEC-C motif-containing protein